MLTDPLDEIRLALPSHVKIEESLESGGQGTVFRGTFRDDVAAIKIFGPGQEDRVSREVDLLSGLRCPCIVKIKGYEKITVQGRLLPVVAYEYLPGGNLVRTYLDAATPQISPENLIEVGRRMGEAVEALWTVRICHRDIKPGNIVLTSDGSPVLVDVGLARHLNRSNLTAAGQVPGTIGYMSPEQYAGRRYLTVHSDVFSLGVTLYQIAAKVHPFDQRQPVVGMAPSAGLSTLRPDIPEPIVKLIEQMLSIRPQLRPIAISTKFLAAAAAN